MTFDPTKPVRTRDGRKVRIVCTDRRGGLPIIAIISNDVKEAVLTYHENGRILVEGNHNSDLINIPEPLDLRNRAWEIFEKRWGKGWVDGVIEKIEMAWKTSGTFPNLKDHFLLGGEMLRLSGILAGLEEGRGDDE